ncbi:phage antirepressor N-terminal domain-containing protein [Candidatus Magnetobacterium casense]|uniref:Phage antirepressor N-terminal domain-containing protein n=1 Tax=Candidatus Magnetobacterium casense TaxID=1455061 RepID=A0ABS6RUA1_9BACT|nr:phage antirepressor N-terminal domain-containing protein [Candidatus Magnetobacterium casensis]MBV6340166.1 phage antirepressor N-terminal domain-containing protein [Candidatus Magnetobacterium casensis]
MNAQNLPTTTQIKFHEDTLVTIKQHGNIYVAMKPICESIGLAWQRQLSQIKDDIVISKGVTQVVIPSSGGPQETTFLLLKYLNGWLFKVNAKRVKNPLTREKLIRYQEECYEVLFEHFNPTAKAAAKPITDNTQDVYMDDDLIVTQFNGERAVLNGAALRLLADFFLFRDGRKRYIPMMLKIQREKEATSCA